MRIVLVSGEVAVEFFKQHKKIHKSFKDTHLAKLGKQPFEVSSWSNLGTDPESKSLRQYDSRWQHVFSRAARLLYIFKPRLSDLVGQKIIFKLYYIRK